MVGWGLNSVLTGWGTNVAFFNPYVVQPVVGQTVPFDFSQPVVVNNFIPAESSGTVAGTESVAQAQPANTDNQLGLDAFNRGLEKFKAARFQDALAELNTALKKIPGDPIVHEVRALTLFAIGDFKSAAANLNSLLASSPGMDWTTMSGLYGDISLYTEHLRKLEAFTKANPSDPASHFVLAYHYLVLDEDAAAIDALKVVVANQPKDVVAQRMIDALVPPASAQATTPAANAPAPIANATTPAANAPAPTAAADVAEPETDLVGSWLAQAKDTKIQLAITEDSKFKWTATTKDQPPVVLEGILVSHSDGLELTNAEQGTIAGGVTSNGENSWNFMISGSPPSDPGLKFTRVN
jgi:predicted Zn-dependent protease